MRGPFDGPRTLYASIWKWPPAKITRCEPSRIIAVTVRSVVATMSPWTAAAMAVGR